MEKNRRQIAIEVIAERCKIQPSEVREDMLLTGAEAIHATIQILVVKTAAPILVADPECISVAEILKQVEKFQPRPWPH